MIKLFLDPDELANRAPIIVLLTDLVTAARDAMSKSFGDPELDMPLMSFKDEVLGVFTVGLKATSSRQPALAGLKAMVNAPTLLEDAELGCIVHNFVDLLLAE
jgi:DNA repair/transcription protein MET18/MMS19